MNAERQFGDQGAGASPSEAHLAEITLELPSLRYIDSYFEAMAEFRAEGTPQVSAEMTREQFPAYVQQLHDQSAGKNLKEGHVPSKEFWIIDADGYAGRIILGLTYTPGPDRVGNHVGYAVRPGKRWNGYATMALRCLLEEAVKLGIYKLMPACGADNVASRKVIERNGGVLLNPVRGDMAGDGELRFLIDLEAHLRMAGGK